jgi:hypothetical protein
MAKLHDVLAERHDHIYNAVRDFSHTDAYIYAYIRKIPRYLELLRHA